jgi:parallel beta-helix repeat protein
MRLIGLFCLTAALSAQTITVSPDGPIRTLAEARDAARARRQGGARGVITVAIRAGTYYLPETLVLGPEDSDTLWQAAPHEHSIISGGRRITGWQIDKLPILKADVAGLDFHQLFVAGRRVMRARTPNFGFFRIDGPSPQDKPIRLHYRGNDIRREWTGAEIVAYFAWADVRMPIVNVDEAAHIAKLAGDPVASNQEADARYYIENTRDALDSPGEWYLDRAAHTVYYWPQEGDRLESVPVTAAVLPQLVRLDGRPGQPVRNVVFRGLTFEHADWTLPPEGYADMQAAMPAPAAIVGEGAIDCAIDRCTIAHSGGYAVWFGRGSQRNRVTASELYDLGAGGVKLGEPMLRSNPADQNFENVVADNHIHDLGLVYAPAVGIWLLQSGRNQIVHNHVHDLGLVYAPAVGIWLLQSGRNQIVHNHVHDLFYTAISAGWTWGYGPNQSKGNLIAHNHLHDIGKQVLSDMGGIYTLGVQPGTEIRNNLIHDISSFTYGGWGIYPDEGSSNMRIEDNIVYACKSAGFHQHYGRENLVRNNIFAFNRENQLMRTRAEEHVSFTFERNIVYIDQGRLLGTNWTGDGFILRNNVYYDRRGPDILFLGTPFVDWQAAGHDTGSVIADPLFINAGNFDFRLRPKSPALRLGFHQIDMTTVGPRVSAGADAW